MTETSAHFKQLKRYNTRGHAHELTFSCHNKNNLLFDPKACEIFLSELQRSRDLENFKIWAYVLMPDHVHLLIWPVNQVYDIAKITGDLKGRMVKRYRDHIRTDYPERFDCFTDIDRSKQRKVFRFWQPGGGFDRNLWNAKAIHNSIAYIEANPVRKGLTISPDKYCWSSAFARATNSGVIPDICTVPVALPDPKHQRIGLM
jgi:putative transposase